MALREDLRRVIRSSAELSGNCRRFAGTAAAYSAAALFTQIADCLDFYLKDLEKELKKHCGS